MPGPNGPLGCLVSYDEDMADMLGLGAGTPPYYLDGGPLLWRGLFLPPWKPLPLAHKMGVPLQFMSFLDGPGSITYLTRRTLSPNHTAMTLNMDLRIESPTFGTPLYLIDYDVMLARSDGKDINSKQIESMVAFASLELREAVAYGCAQRSRPPKSSTTGTKKVDDDEESSDDEEDNRYDAKQWEHVQGFHQLGQTVTKDQAATNAAKATPENFVAFFEKYRNRRAETDKEWEAVECPVDLGPLKCKRCGKRATEDQLVQACSGCKLVHYCGKYFHRCYNVILDEADNSQERTARKKIGRSTKLCARLRLKRSRTRTQRRL